MLGKKGELKEAVACYKRAIEIAERIGYEDMLAYSYVDIGVVIMKKGDLYLAEKYLSSGAEKAYSVGNSSYYAAAYDGLAKIYRSAGNTVGLVEALAEFVKNGKTAFPRASIQALYELCVIKLIKNNTVRHRNFLC